MSVELPRVAILGAGSMGGAILSGLTAPGVTVDGGIRVTNRTEAKAALLRAPEVTSLALELEPDANAIALAGARLVVVAVKPAMVPDLLRDIVEHLEPDAIVVSVAAGVTTASMEALVPNPVLRAMPNTPSTVGLGVTGVTAGSRAGEDEVELVRALFATVGDVLVVSEDGLDRLSTISGSGPAYVFLLIEQLIGTAERMGFTADEARVMVHGTFRGASELLAASDVDAAELRRRVTSPKGTTERAVAVLQDADLGDVFDRATAAALARTKELAQLAAAPASSGGAA